MMLPPPARLDQRHRLARAIEHAVQIDRDAAVPVLGSMSSTLRGRPGDAGVVDRARRVRRVACPTSANSRSTSANFATSATRARNLCRQRRERRIVDVAHVHARAVRQRKFARSRGRCPRRRRSRGRACPWRTIPSRWIIAHGFQGEASVLQEHPQRAAPVLDRAGRAARHLAHGGRDPLAAAHPGPALPDLRRRARGRRGERRDLMGLFFYAALVMSFRYANFYRRETRWKIALETAGMIAFITWVLWYTDGLASPLLNAYLLPVITAALTLGKVATLVDVGADRRLLPLPRRSRSAAPSSARCPSSARSSRSSRRCCWSPTSPPCSRPTSATACARQAALRDRRPDRACSTCAASRIAANRLFAPGAALRPRRRAC